MSVWCQESHKEVAVLIKKTTAIDQMSITGLAELDSIDAPRLIGFFHVDMGDLFLAHAGQRVRVIVLGVPPKVAWWDARFLVLPEILFQCPQIKPVLGKDPFERSVVQDPHFHSAKSPSSFSFTAARYFAESEVTALSEATEG